MLFTMLPRSTKMTVLLLSITFTGHSVPIVSMERVAYFFGTSTPLLPLSLTIVFEHIMIFVIWRYKCSSWSTPIPDRELRRKHRATKVHVFISSPEPACRGELLGCFSCPGSGLNQLALSQSLEWLGSFMGLGWFPTGILGVSKLFWRPRAFRCMNTISGRPVGPDARVQLMACLVPWYKRGVLSNPSDPCSHKESSKGVLGEVKTTLKVHLLS